MKKQPNLMAQLTEQELDVYLQSTAVFAPDPNMLPRTSPLQRSLSLLLWGLALCSIRLHIWNLQYILPAFGTILLVLALIPLRWENRWFRLAWLGTWLNWGVTGLHLFLLGTVRYASILSGTPGKAFTTLAAAVFFALYLGILLGTQTLRKKTGLQPHYRKVVYELSLLLAAWIWSARIAPSLPGLLVILMFIGLFRGLQKVLRYAFDEIEETGYAAHLRPFALSAHILGILLGAVLLGCTILGLRLGQEYPMHWDPVNLQQEHQGQEALFDRLISLGMPENLLQDMTAEDAAALEGAKQIVVNREPLVIKQNMWLLPLSSTSSEEPNLILTTVAVSFSEDDQHLQLIHHFHWVKAVPLGRTASVNIQVSNVESTSGRILYDRNGQTISAPYHNITGTTANLSISHGGEPWVVAVFSIPRDVSHLRGYLMAESDTFSYALGFTANSHYFFRNQWFAYPAPDASPALTDFHLIADPTKGFYHAQQYVAGNLDP